jgi:predicted RNA binding protein YcfA (HicA-like mRNA interferase family)
LSFETRLRQAALQGAGEKGVEHHIYTGPGHGISISVPVHGNKTLKAGTQRSIMKAAGLKDNDL